MKIIFSALIVISTLFANADCTSPVGKDLAIKYFSGDLYYCQSSSWVNLYISDSGLACTIPGQFKYIDSTNGYRYCNGSTWIDTKNTCSSTTGSCTLAESGKLKTIIGFGLPAYCDGSSYVFLSELPCI